MVLDTIEDEEIQTTILRRFAENEILTMDDFWLLTDGDFKEMGIPIGMKNKLKKKAKETAIGPDKDQETATDVSPPPHPIQGRPHLLPFTPGMK